MQTDLTWPRRAQHANLRQTVHVVPIKRHCHSPSEATECLRRQHDQYNIGSHELISVQDLVKIMTRAYYTPRIVRHRREGNVLIGVEEEKAPPAENVNLAAPLYNRCRRCHFRMGSADNNGRPSC